MTVPLLDIQRKAQQIGRIRTGVMIKGANGKMRPDKLTTFMFTTTSRATAETIAEAYGGDVQPWTPQKGIPAWGVTTETSEIGVIVPPVEAVVSSWYEMWTGGGCVRRCDSVTETITGGPCVCPSDPKERSAQAKLNPPQACGTKTRVNVTLPDLPGTGVWRLDTGSYYAAAEMDAIGELLDMARDQNIAIPARLRIDQRMRVAGGETKKFPVVVLESLLTFRELASGEAKGRPLADLLPPPPPRLVAIAAARRAAIESGAGRVALTAGPAVPATPREAAVAAPVVSEPDPEGHTADFYRDAVVAVADAAREDPSADPTVVVAEVRSLWARANRDKVLGVMVEVATDTQQELGQFIREVATDWQ